MSFSSNMQVVASRLLTQYGEDVDVSRPNIILVDPSTGIATEGSPTSFSGVGHPSKYETPYIDNITVLQTDIKLIFYSVTAPTVGDVFTLNSVDYTALSVQRVRAQGSNIYYIVQLRQ
jgi:hypothetical protein